MLLLHLVKFIFSHSFIEYFSLTFLIFYNFIFPNNIFVTLVIIILFSSINPYFYHSFTHLCQKTLAGLLKLFLISISWFSHFKFSNFSMYWCLVLAVQLLYLSQKKEFLGQFQILLLISVDHIDILLQLFCLTLSLFSCLSFFFFFIHIIFSYLHLTFYQLTYCKYILSLDTMIFLSGRKPVPGVGYLY